MSNQERDPGEVLCESRGGDAAIEVIGPRDVPLGGPRAMTVRRTLPSRRRSLIGAWCFLDHYGPDPVSDTGGMVVTPHPHTGLATVSWLFTGEVEHKDSAGNRAMVLPGEVNLMTAGHGISHSENSTERTDILHGAQLWLALPDAARDVAPGFDHYAPEPVTGEGWEARVFLGSLLGSTSPVPTHSPLLGAEVVLASGTELVVDVDPAFEHGLLVDHGVASLEGQEVKAAELAYVPPGRQRLHVVAGQDTRVLLLGGTPFGESIIMWWNFVGRTHEEIVQYREEWQAQILRDGDLVTDGQDVAQGRFGAVVDDHDTPIPAPPMPNARLRHRR